MPTRPDMEYSMEYTNMTSMHHAYALGSGIEGPGSRIKDLGSNIQDPRDQTSKGLCTRKLHRISARIQ